MKPFWMICRGVFLLSWVLWVACRPDGSAVRDRIEQTPPISPDYVGVTVPCNIAPLNFRIPEATWMEVTVATADGTYLTTVQGEGLASFPLEDWHRWLALAAGSSLQFDVTVWNDKYPHGVRYLPFTVWVSTDSIDAYIAYRLIEPGYELWHEMGIYQRDLTTFEEQPIVTNQPNQEGCINCHSFCNYSPDTYLFHARGANGTTVVVQHGKLQRLDLHKQSPYRMATYPAWHPSGRYLLYSSNDTHQSFYHFGRMPVEVYDLSSDLLLYDFQEGKVLQDSRFTNEEQLETFPTFSPDGQRVYFCVAPYRKMPMENRELHYALCAVDFDAEQGHLGGKVDTLYQPATEKGSASFPRLSPDGRFLLFTESACATFPIWHKEADLQMIRLTDGARMDTDVLNSDESESYHSWSSNGRWVLFSSRRLDGRYTRLFVASVDTMGRFGKPFLLPQADPKEHTLRLKSYNIPEFVTGKVQLNSRQLRLLLNP